MNVSFEQHANFRERPNARRERRPGRRERHCLQSARFLRHPPLASNITSLMSRTDLSTNTLQTSTSSRLKIFKSRVHATQHVSIPVQEEEVEETTQCKYSEKESLQPKSSEFLFQEYLRPQTAAPKLPDWLGDIDVHLDVTSIDVISPFESVSGISDASEDTYNNMPRVGIIYDESDDFDDNEENVNDESFSDDEKQRQKTNLKYLSNTPARSTERLVSSTTSVTSPGITSPGITSRTQSPRRYQGDMKVMSMQTGGIRSTPFQPESKKFINQMITYKHMKMHNKKTKLAKPTVDTRMPKTFLKALERKYLVENRLSDSWDRSYATSSPISNDNKSTPQSKHSKHKK